MENDLLADCNDNNGNNISQRQVSSNISNCCSPACANDDLVDNQRNILGNFAVNCNSTSKNDTNSDSIDTSSLNPTNNKCAVDCDSQNIAIVESEEEDKKGKEEEEDKQEQEKKATRLNKRKANKSRDEKINELNNNKEDNNKTFKVTSKSKTNNNKKSINQRPNKTPLWQDSISRMSNKFSVFSFNSSSTNSTATASGYGVASCDEMLKATTKKTNSRDNNNCCSSTNTNKNQNLIATTKRRNIDAWIETKLVSVAFISFLCLPSNFRLFSYLSFFSILTFSHTQQKQKQKSAAN